MDEVLRKLDTTIWKIIIFSLYKLKKIKKFFCGEIYISYYY